MINQIVSKENIIAQNMKTRIDDQSKPQTMIQEKYTKRYQNLKVAEALSNNHLYPFACNELSSIIDLGYSQLPKDLKAFIFRDCLSAFRLLPE